jgi:long-chain acyl-CoA synthetase
VLGDGLDHCVALIIPNFGHLRSDYPEFKELTDEQIALDDRVRKKIKEEIEAVNKTLAGFEMVKKHSILSRPFSIDSGELTPSFKVKRNVIKERYTREIASITR